MNRTLSVFVLIATIAIIFTILPSKAHAWCDPRDLVCGDIIDSTNADGHTDISRYNCTGTVNYTGKAHVFAIHHPGGTFWASLDWTDSHTSRGLAMFILTDCNANHCIAFDPHFIQTTLPAGYYWIIIDGRETHAIDYILHIYCGDHPEPVEMVSFNGASANNGVRLSWSVASEVNNAGFIVERQAADADRPERIAFVDGRGTDASSRDYVFVDPTALPGVTYNYHLSSQDLSGARQSLGDVTVEYAAPTAPVTTDFQLQGNYPNPFNPTTTIRFSVGQSTELMLSVYDVNGRLVQTLANQTFAAGEHAVTFDASNLSTGLYFARLTGASHTDLMKMVLIK